MDELNQADGRIKTPLELGQSAGAIAFCNVSLGTPQNWRFYISVGDFCSPRCNDKVLKLFGRRVGLCVEWSDVNGVQVCCK